MLSDNFSAYLLSFFILFPKQTFLLCLCGTPIVVITTCDVEHTQSRVKDGFILLRRIFFKIQNSGVFICLWSVGESIKLILLKIYDHILYLIQFS